MMIPSTEDEYNLSRARVTLWSLGMDTIRPRPVE